MDFVNYYQQCYLVFCFWFFFSILSVLSSKIDDLMHLRPLNIQVWIFDHQVPCDLAYLWNKLFSPRLYVSATISSKAHRNNFKCVKLISFDFLIDDLVEIGAGSHPSISFFLHPSKLILETEMKKKLKFVWIFQDCLPKVYRVGLPTHGNSKAYLIQPLETILKHLKCYRLGDRPKKEKHLVWARLCLKLEIHLKSCFSPPYIFKSKSIGVRNFDS